jgi:hypothetical protein
MELDTLCGMDKKALRHSRAMLFFAALGMAVWTQLAMAQNAPPTKLQGTWVPTRATCQSPVRVLVAATTLTLVNGKDSEALGGIEMAGPGYFAPDYQGIMAVLISEFNGQQPATATFNVGEKKGVAQVDFSPVMPGKPNAQLNAYNARITKLNLAKRFPLDKVLLKKCA